MEYAIALLNWGYEGVCVTEIQLVHEKKKGIFFPASAAAQEVTGYFI